VPEKSEGELKNEKSATNKGNNLNSNEQMGNKEYYSRLNLDTMREGYKEIKDLLQKTRQVASFLSIVFVALLTIPISIFYNISSPVLMGVAILLIFSSISGLILSLLVYLPKRDFFTVTADERTDNKNEEEINTEFLKVYKKAYDFNINATMRKRNLLALSIYTLMFALNIFLILMVSIIIS